MEQMPYPYDMTIFKIRDMIRTNKRGFCPGCKQPSYLTKHHIHGGGRGPWIWLCRPCHDLKH